MRIPPTICVAVRCVVAIGHEKFAIGLKFSEVLSMIREIRRYDMVCRYVRRRWISQPNPRAKHAWVLAHSWMLCVTEENAMEPNANADDSARETSGRQILDAATTMSTLETVQRYGNANAEYIKGYTGRDELTGQTFTHGLKKISGYKLDPVRPENSIAQQAGYAAEVAATSRDNAEAIISGSPVRTVRSDDHPQYRRNDDRVDRIRVLDGQIIEGSQSQMKFVGNRDRLLEKIAAPDGEFSRYRGLKLELPSEQYVDAEAYCRAQAADLRRQADVVDARGKPEVALHLRAKADNYEQLAGNLLDTGLTSDDAKFYRTHPLMATVRDIAHTSHRAGLEGARGAFMVGAAISMATNAYAVATERRGMIDAGRAVLVDGAVSAGMGYATAASGAALTAVMQQSGRQSLQVLSRTAAPAMVVDVCVTMTGCIRRYARGEIDGVQFLDEIGEKGSGMMASAMMAALGQIAIPVPVVGAAIGGMIGCTLSSIFYRETLEAARSADLAAERLALAIELNKAAREEILAQRLALAQFIAAELPVLNDETAQLLCALDTTQPEIDADGFAAAINRFALLLGSRLQFASLQEFDLFMTGDEPLRL